MKKIPFKNYLIVLVISLFTIIIALIATKYYLEQKKVKMEVNIDFATEVMEQELDNYIVENRDIMIYLTNSTTLDMEINKKLKEVIEKTNHQNDVIHFNITSSTNVSSIFSKYNNKNYEIKDNSLVIVKNEKIVNVVDLTKTKSYIKNHIEYYYGE